MEQPSLPDLEDDFADLDEIIAASEIKRAADRGIGAKQRRLAKGGLNEDERFALLAEIRHYEESFVWQTVAAVALFHTQHCTTCGHDQRFFMGWMALQDHRRDPNCRRLIRGKPVGDLPQRIEHHAQPHVELCSDCAEASIIISQFIKD